MKIGSSSILASVLLLLGSANGFLPTSLKQAVSSNTQLFKYKVFIDGEAGTTGLQVRQRIESRDDLEIISAPDELRKDEATRKKLINEADAVILCKYYLQSRACELAFYFVRFFVFWILLMNICDLSFVNFFIFFIYIFTYQTKQTNQQTNKFCRFT